MPVLTAQSGIPAAQRASIRHGYAVRPCSPEHAAAPVRLSLASYPIGGCLRYAGRGASRNRGHLCRRVRRVVLAASPVVRSDDVLVAVVLTVRRANWEGAPADRYISEAFTAADQRRRGPARSAMTAALAALSAAGERQVALTVTAANAPALALYRAKGFADAEGA